MSKKQPDPFIFLGTPSSISWSLWLLTLPLSFVLTFSFMPSGLEGHLVALCVIAVIAHLATGLVLYIGRVLLLSDFNRLNAKFLMVIVFMLSGVARGTTVGQLTVSLNIEKDPYFTYRITSSIVTLVFTFVLLSTLISNGINNRIESDQLRAYIENLNQLKTESKAQVLGIREKVQDEIRRILTSNLSQVTSEDQITLISEKMIRPFGHQLFLNTFKPIDFPKYLPSRTRLNSKELAV